MHLYQPLPNDCIVPVPETMVPFDRLKYVKTLPSCIAICVRSPAFAKIDAAYGWPFVITADLVK